MQKRYKHACIIKELLNFHALFSQNYSEKLRKSAADRVNQSLIVLTGHVGSGQQAQLKETF